MLQRVDWQRDLHFQTRTTIDTLDYSGSGLNEGSKVVIAAVGAPRRNLPTELPGDLQLPVGFREPRVCLPGVLAVSGPHAAATGGEADEAIERFCQAGAVSEAVNRFPLVVVVDDSDFTARTLNNFLWVVFTRSNPAADIYGIDSFTQQKHWGCRGSLVIDARIKPHHAPPLSEDPGGDQTSRRPGRPRRAVGQVPVIRRTEFIPFLRRKPQLRQVNGMNSVLRRRHPADDPVAQVGDSWASANRILALAGMTSSGLRRSQ